MILCRGCQRQIGEFAPACPACGRRTIDISPSPFRTPRRSTAKEALTAAQLIGGVSMFAGCAKLLAEGRPNPAGDGTSIVLVCAGLAVFAAAVAIGRWSNRS